jgi:hypothetical protein
VIHYKEGYLYQTTRADSWQTAIYPQEPIINRYYSLSAQGPLTVNEGFAWDGATSCPEWLVPPECSGPHDALCQMLRTGALEYDLYASWVHGLLRDMVQARRGKIAAWLVFKAVTTARGGHPDNADDNPEKTDP